MNISGARLGTATCAALAALVVFAAPATAQSAQPAQSCNSLGPSQVKCESPGNVQINDSPPQVNFFPYAS